MPYISQITLPSGSVYDIKDAWARTQIEAITGGSAIVFKGVSTTLLTDGGNQNPTVGGSEISTKATGDLYFYGQEEFIYGDDNVWHSLGQPLSTLGELATKDYVSVAYDKTTSVTSSFSGSASDVSVTVAANASGNYTPSGTITGGTFSGSESTFTGDFTPAGSISLNTTNKTATVSSTTGTATYTPGATVSAPTI